MKKDIITFDAVIDTIVYDSDNYKVYGVTPVSNIENIKLTKYGNTTIIGNIPKLNVGSKYTLNTVEEYNNRYSSNQYKVISIDTKVPKTDAEIRVFLNEILVPQQVEELLREYPNVIDLVMSGKESEIDVKKLFNIGEYRIQVIVDKIKENYLFLDLINFFSDYEVSITLVKNLLTKYGSAEEIKKRFETEPYKILTEIDGIGFKRADEKILKGKPQMIDSRDRLEAALYHILDENENSGNTFAHMSKVLDTLKALVPQTLKHIQQVLYDDRPDWIISTKNIVAKKSTYETEKNVAEILFEMNNIKNNWWFKESNLNYNHLTEEQCDAIKNVMKYNVSLLAGVAGSGKSFTIGKMIEMLDDLDRSYIILAPTGKASKTIAQYTKRDASTIHRGLAFNPSNIPPWGYNKDNKLDVDLVIVDETSMVDVFLMENLLNAIDIKNTKLLLIGDPAQIPSVSCGNVYQDMLNSKIFPTTTLTKIFRYGEGGLYKVATNIRSGNEYFKKIEKEITPFGENKDYIFVKCDKEDANKKVLQIYHSLIKKEIPYSDIVVTMAMNKNKNGSVMVNKLIQSYLKKNTTYLTDDSIEYGKNKFYVGDIVMQTKNDYKAQTISGMVKPIFNGTLGIIVDIKGQDIHIKFDDDIMLYKKSGLNNILLGYAINTFKCQGSQFPYVIYSHPSSHSYFTNRNLAYTAVSRTQKQCYHISDEKTVRAALKKSAIFDRNTLLKSLILKKYKEVNVDEL